VFSNGRSTRVQIERQIDFADVFLIRPDLAIETNHAGSHLASLY
jgi:hypothetical protein